MIRDLPQGDSAVLEAGGLQIEASLRGPWMIELVDPENRPLTEDKVRRVGAHGDLLLIDDFRLAPVFTVRIRPTGTARFPAGARAGARFITIGDPADRDEIHLPSVDAVGLSEVDLATVVAVSGRLEIKACVITGRRDYKPRGAAAHSQFARAVYDLARHIMAEAGLAPCPTAVVAVDGSASIRRAAASSDDLTMTMELLDALAEALSEQPVERIALLGRELSWVAADDDSLACQRLVPALVNGPAVVGACLGQLRRLSAPRPSSSPGDSGGQEHADGPALVFLVSDTVPGGVELLAAELGTKGWELRLIVLSPDPPPQPAAALPWVQLPPAGDAASDDLKTALQGSNCLQDLVCALTLTSSNPREDLQ
ncbi:MAG: hypothetical protein LBI84_02320 [Propionibacteriaceae bacterium]|jgi:hypothetical protein|nr:hypothetical protein [Propionibacteriaceae bacterium]